MRAMNKSRESFSFPSCRNLCRYLGEADAMVELTELATRSFTAEAAAYGDVEKFVRAASERFGIRVNLSEVDSLQRYLCRHYIVTVYESAECFLHDFRREHTGLYGREWTGDANNIDPLTLAMKNIAETEAKAATYVGQDLISRFHYYRSVRNWVVHTKQSNPSKPLARFSDIVSYSAENRDRFGPVAAPNKPGSLTFDDFILFSRLTKYVAERLSLLARPPDDHWINTLSSDMKRFRRLRMNPTRMKNSIAGRLRTEYGIDAPTADWIAQELQENQDSLA